MVSIYIKELKQYFKSMIGYIFLTIFLLICGFYFMSRNILSQNGDIKTFFSSIFSVLIFLIPILTMRLFSEEKKMNTQQLLFTVPISKTDIVIGKYLATLTVFSMGMLVTLLFPIILAYYGSFELMVIAGNYFGIVLLVSAFIAIGIFISVLTENQVVAAVVSYTLLMTLWLIDSVGVFIAKGFLKDVIGYISLNSNFREFTLGIFNPASIIYYVSITIFFLVLSIMVLENRNAI